MTKVRADALAWARNPSLANRLLTKARFFLETGEYFKSIVCLFEAFQQWAQDILNAAGERPTLDGDLQKRAEKLANAIQTHGGEDLYQAFWALRLLRNAVVHGSKPRKAMDALKDEKEMITLLETVLKKLGKRLGPLAGARAATPSASANPHAAATSAKDEAVLGHGAQSEP